jgi:hypothetical protein
MHSCNWNYYEAWSLRLILSGLRQGGALNSLQKLLCVAGIHSWRFKETDRGQVVKFCHRCTRGRILYPDEPEFQRCKKAHSQ